MSTNLLTENGNPASADCFIDKAELAIRLKMTPRTITNWMQRGFVPYVKIGDGKRARVLFRWNDVAAHLNERFRRVGGGR